MARTIFLASLFLLLVVSISSAGFVADAGKIGLWHCNAIDPAEGTNGTSPEADGGSTLAGRALDFHTPPAGVTVGYGPTADEALQFNEGDWARANGMWLPGEGPQSIRIEALFREDDASVNVDAYKTIAQHGGWAADKVWRLQVHTYGNGARRMRFEVWDNSGSGPAPHALENLIYNSTAAWNHVVAEYNMDTGLMTLTTKVGDVDESTVSKAVGGPIRQSPTRAYVDVAANNAGTADRFAGRLDELMISDPTVPEPATMLLLGLGCVGVIRRRS